MYFIREVSLPCTIAGMVVPDAEDNYNIYINNALSEEKKRETLKHELRHIVRGDCFSEKECLYLETDKQD